MNNIKLLLKRPDLLFRKMKLWVQAKLLIRDFDKRHPEYTDYAKDRIKQLRKDSDE